MVNIVGMCNLLVVFFGFDCCLLVVLLVSSVNIYGNLIVGVFDEIVVFVLVNDYVVSKFVMEYVVKLWVDWLLIVIVWLFNYMGVG